MQLKQLTKLGVHYLIHNLTEVLYLKGNYDITKPLSIRAVINERCNYKCRYCNFWRQKARREEMTILQWQAALLSLKKFIGPFLIQFSGGEVFIKKGFIDLLQFCHHEGIEWGLITNGSVFNPEVVKKIVAAKPMNIDISVDSATAEIHDFVRGMPNSLNTITQGIGFLKKERDRLKLTFPIRIKPTVHFYNYHTLPELVEWTKRIGATSIDFSPMRPVSKEVDMELWLSKASDIESLRKIIEILITMKQDGAPIETSEEKLRSFPEHFLGKKITPSVSPCRVGLRDYYILPNGDITMCWFYPVIGNAKTDSARDIWYSDKAKTIRDKIVGCDKFGSVDCANSCLSHRTFLQEIKRGLQLLRRRGKKTME